VPVSVRVATLADVPFMDALQKRHELGVIYQLCVAPGARATPLLKAG
jgi:hypothetical protein